MDTNDDMVERRANSQQETQYSAGKNRPKAFQSGSGGVRPTDELIKRIESWKQVKPVAEAKKPHKDSDVPHLGNLARKTDEPETMFPHFVPPDNEELPTDDDSLAIALQEARDTREPYDYPPDNPVIRAFPNGLVENLIPPSTEAPEPGFYGLPFVETTMQSTGILPNAEPVELRPAVDLEASAG